MNAQFKDPVFLSAFIDKYREMKNLWEVKHPQYYLKHVRKSTLERLLSFVQTTIPEATMETLLKKIGILRNMYKREHNKIHESMRSGASADDVYVPRLWYYNKLRFLDDQTEAKASLSTLPSTLPCTLPSTPAEADEDQAGSSILDEPDMTIWSQDEASQEECGESGRQEETGPMDSLEEARFSIILEEAGPCVRQEEAGPSVRQEVAGPSVRQEVAGPSVRQEVAGPSVRQEEVAGPSRSLTQSQVPPLHLPKKRARKGTVTQEASLRLMREATKFLRSPPEAEEAYGCYLASRLLKMEWDQRLICERLFGETIQKGLQGTLTRNTQLHEAASPPPPPSPPTTTQTPEPQPPKKAAGKAAGKRRK
ncbi:hypothetical protein AB205_0037510 [Aquarana catesbeiana]|uniref:MADF domain-containing protein n=1 Tax=Aquarana catesbeiana TaxID=8400 RepID=A0A2G9Q6I2_AQUCT|nr:hypothetical protein AB205_0037510 [Aquarana catesbeiana]